MSTLSAETHSVEETVALGRALGELLQPGDVVALVGPLGAGKTYFTKGIAAGLGVADTAKVVSPSFVLVREHLGRGHGVGTRLRHVDAYRLRHPRELTELGAEELFDEMGVTVVEWADRFPPGTIPAVLEVQLSHVSPTMRELRFTARSERGMELVSALRRVRQLTDTREAPPPLTRAEGEA
jgi:tRNA threonylcarbamoyladenosine biosynthesis protein TsaE